MGTPDPGRVSGEGGSPRLVACAALAFLLVNYPLLAVFADGGRLLGLPVLPLYVFGAWTLVVGLAARLSRER